MMGRGRAVVFFNMHEGVAAHDDNRHEEGHDCRAQRRRAHAQEKSDQVKAQQRHAHKHAHLLKTLLFGRDALTIFSPASLSAKGLRGQIPPQSFTNQTAVTLLL